MEQHMTDEQPAEVVESETTEIIEQMVITEETEHVISNTTELQGTVYMIPSIGTTIEILHTDDAEEVCTGNTAVHNVNHDDNETVKTTLDETAALQFHSDQTEDFERNEGTDIKSELKVEQQEGECIGQEDANLAPTDGDQPSFDESDPLETDNREASCNSETVISIAVNETDSDYMGMDQDMLPDCVNQNCDPIDRSEFQLTEEPNKTEFIDQSETPTDNQKLDVPIEENTETVDLLGPVEIVTSEECEVNSFVTSADTEHTASDVVDSSGDISNEIELKFVVDDDDKVELESEGEIVSTRQCTESGESVNLQNLESEPAISLEVVSETNEEADDSGEILGESEYEYQGSETKTTSREIQQILKYENEEEIPTTETLTLLESSATVGEERKKTRQVLENNGNELCTIVKVDVLDVEVQCASDTHEGSDSISDVCQVENIDSVKSKTPGAAEKRRSVIQDIVDDWMDENNEDIGECKHQPSKSQDAVEIELKSLLAESKSDNRGGKVITTKPSPAANPATDKAVKRQNTDATQAKTLVKAERNAKDVTLVSKEHKTPEAKKTLAKESATMSQEIPNYIPPHLLGRSLNNPMQDSMTSKHKPQSPRPGVKIPGRHLTSQIATSAEVSELMKERIKEKQKDFEVPEGGDILFVKKITQRLSSKLSGSSNNPIPGLIPLPQTARSVPDSHETTMVESNKGGSVDNTELLAILEGDVDPDWSNLNPPTLTEVHKIADPVVEHGAPPKLDPSVERELALKQLLELPSIPIKKNPSHKKKKTFKPAPSKVLSYETDKVTELNDKEKTIVSIDLVGTEPVLKEKNDDTEKTDVTIESTDSKEIENEQLGISSSELKLDESRSGRKRKPTEKAREHEQNTTKRQKVYKGKVSLSKKPSQTGATMAQGRSQHSRKANDNPQLRKSQSSQQSVVAAKQASSKGSSEAESKSSKDQTLYVARVKSQSLVKRGPQAIAKRKMAVKKLLRQKSSANGTSKKSVNLKSKLAISPKKTGAKVKAKVQKRMLDVSSGDAKPKKKTNEIDKLLQDEGVVNLLYDVEQPDKKKRLVPITKSQTKVMDMQKVQRELKIRTKLVRNAVLRLRTSSSGSGKGSSRSKRTVGHSNDSLNDGKEGEQVKSPRSTISSPTDFIFPAKIRNAADASIIIRRHSSSSFSSASGSPRVSIDAPEKQAVEMTKPDETGAHVTRSARRRHSQDEKAKPPVDAKKSKKKSVQKAEADKPELKSAVETGSTVADEKCAMATRSNKRSEAKKVEKTGKHIEVIDVDESSNSSSVSKIVTRSNGTSSAKAISKSKKTAKSKVTFGKVTDLEGSENEPKQEDELSACLAAAANALSNVDGAPSRSGSTTENRKQKVNANVAKTEKTETDGAKKEKTEVANRFSNKEVNVRRHGNLVQLILTPSSSTKIRNGITLQVMRELRETLSILRRDEECRVVLLTSTGGSFCEGLDLASLIYSSKEERRIHAQEMANGVKDFIKSLASFNKPIVAGVQGAAVGLGVTMLPLFDLVIASDKATFSTPYGKLGQIPEGASILTLSHTLGSAVTSELLLGGRTLTANEALRAGLVTRVLWPDRFQEELLPSLLAMSEQSPQSMEATKALLRHSLRKKLDAALESESYLLVQHWCSAECQAAIKAYIDGMAH